MPRPTLSYFVLGVILLISVAGLRRLTFATDVLEVLPEGIPEVEALQVFRNYFDDDHRVILLLRNEEEVFEEDAADFTSFLREKLPEARIEFRQRFEGNLEKAAPSLARIWMDSDPELVAALAEKLLDPGRRAAFLQERKEAIALSLDQGEATMTSYDPLGLANHPAMAQLEGSGFNHQSENGKLWLVMIANPDLGIDYRTHAKWVEKIREAADDWDQEGFDYALTGGPVFSSEVGAGMENDMAGTVSITLVIVSLLFWLTQRSLPQLGILGLIVGIVFVMTLGLAGWVFGTLNLVSVGFAAILLGLVIDYGVVIARESSPGMSALRLRREMAPGILWAALTTAVVFGILMLSTFKGVQQLGGLVLIGLTVGAVVCLWLMPMALQKFPQKPAARLLTPPFPGKKPALGFLGILLLGAASVFLINGPPQIDFDVAMVEPEESEAAATLEVLQELFPAWSKKNLSVVANGRNLGALKEAALDARAGIAALKESGVIVSSEWPVGLIPDLEARKANIGPLNKIADQSVEIIADMEIAGFSAKGRALDAAIIRFFGAPSDELDPLTKLFYHPDGYFTGRIQLKEVVNEVNAEQVKILNRENVTVSGWGVLRFLLLDRVRADLYFLFIPATLVLFGALILVFRSWRDALLTAGILLTVLLLVNAMAVVSGRPWNFLSSMAIPLIVGTGIDYSIHLIFALRRNDGDLAKVWNGVGKGIFFCGLSTVVGFGSLAFASNQTLQSMGLFCSVGVFLTMTLSVLLVPALWSPRSRRG